MRRSTSASQACGYVDDRRCRPAALPPLGPNLPASREKFDFTPEISSRCMAKNPIGAKIYRSVRCLFRGRPAGSFLRRKNNWQGDSREPREASPHGCTRGPSLRLLTSVDDTSPSSQKTYTSILTPRWRRLRCPMCRRPATVDYNLFARASRKTLGGGPSVCFTALADHGFDI
jgi:hypothetical protein